MREKQMLESQLQQAQEKILTEAKKEALIAEIVALDELVYVVDDNRELAQKNTEAAPCFDFALNNAGEPVDIISILKPIVVPEPTETELTQQAITDLGLTTIEQGQKITDLKLMILGGMQNLKEDIKKTISEKTSLTATLCLVLLTKSKQQRFELLKPQPNKNNKIEVKKSGGARLKEILTLAKLMIREHFQ